MSETFVTMHSAKALHDQSYEELIMQSNVIKQSLISFTVLFLTGCASLPNVKVQDIGSRKVACASKGEGTPVIVFESGYGDLMSTWAPIFESLSEVTIVFAYDRPGYGHSTLNPAPATARKIEN